MLKKLKEISLPHLFGFSLLFVGWLLSITYVGLTGRLAVAKPILKILFHPMSFSGFLIIVIGAYLPELFRLLRKNKNP